MHINCNICGKPVSTSVPEGTVIKAWVECPECIERQDEENSMPKLNDPAHHARVDAVLSFYVGEPCRICGKPMQQVDISEARWVGYSVDNTSCIAHGTCWDDNIAKSKWWCPSVPLL